MTSRTSILNTPSSKRPYSYENGFSPRKHKGSTTPSRTAPSPSPSSFRQRTSILPSHNGNIKQNGRITLDSMDNYSVPSRDNTAEEIIKEAQTHLEDMLGREKTANERASKVELERDELKSKMNDLKNSYQQRIQILVEELERYKTNPSNNKKHLYDNDDDTQALKKERDQLQTRIDQLTSDTSYQATQLKSVEKQLNDKITLVERLEEEMSHLRNDKQFEYETELEKLQSSLNEKQREVNQLRQQNEQLVDYKKRMTTST
ncbi:hypothetical protein BJ944DRAFT_122655 [Cunninghamella echinulata]|nr:hypothetical protein BJ944DRAFT_122655 [Cunninghamella echinulata]